jgi:hypothetical protein
VEEYRDVSSDEQAKAIEEAKRKEEYQRRRELEDLKLLLEHKEFRSFIWRVLSRASVFSTVMSEGEGRIFYNSGRQDFGHWLMDEVVKAEPKAFLQMMQEARTYKGEDPQ